MARFAVGGRQTAAPTALLPSGSLYAVAAARGMITEIGITNTTAVACVVGLCRMTTAGTQGAALVEAPMDANSVAAQCTGVNSHTSTGPTLTDLGYRFTLGAAVGAGVIWTFGDRGIIIPIGTGNGIGIYCPTGTGQVCDFYYVWDE